MRAKNPVLLLGLLVVLMLPQGAALHCNGDITTISAGGETLYIDVRSDGTGEVSIWAYLETNGEPGLQSGGEPINGDPVPLLTVHDPCDHPNPDGVIIV